MNVLGNTFGGIHSVTIRRTNLYFRFQTCLRRLSSIGARHAEAGKALGPAWMMDDEGEVNCGMSDGYPPLPQPAF